MQNCEMVRAAKLSDIPYIVDLAAKESKCLGFIPKMAYESAITGIKTGKRWSNVCNDRLWVCENNGDLVGFVLASFGRTNAYRPVGKIAQICLQEDARLLARGKLLLDKAIKHGLIVGTTEFGCGCADDLESNLFWLAMGFTKVGQRYGISHKNTWVQSSKRLVNIYKYDPNDMFFNI